MKFDLRHPTCCLLLILGQTGFAVPVDDLYVAEVLVASQSEAERIKGVKIGLARVLARVSGDLAVTNNSTIRRALSRAHEYYYQYGFEPSDLTLEIGDETIAAQVLRVHFEPSSVARLLRSAAFRVWGSNRPSVLLWIAIETESGRELLSETSDSELVDVLEEHARRRGLPLLYPLLDLEDKANLSPAAVWGAFQHKIALASLRYQPESILSGRVYQGRDGEWFGHWSYRIGDDWRSFVSLSLRLDDLIADVIDRLSDRLAVIYGIDSSRHNVWLRIAPVDELVDYVELTRYLENLTPVLVAFVEEVSGDEVLYRLSTEGQRQQLIELINLDRKLLLLSSSGQVLEYRWLP